MSKELEWTRKLGDAFLAQQKDVMDAVQKLRTEAYSRGNLKTTKEQKVIYEEQVIRIEPASPTVVYVPAYNPTVVYGAWPYPAYPPDYYPSYYPTGAVIGAGLLGFAAGVAVGSSWWGWADCNWHGGDININRNSNINVNRNDIRAGKWEHNAVHRKGVGYRNEDVRQRYSNVDRAGIEQRRDFRGHDRPGTATQRPDPGRPGMGDRDRGERQRPGDGKPDPGGDRRPDLGGDGRPDQGGDRRPDLGGSRDRGEMQRPGDRKSDFGEGRRPDPGVSRQDGRDMGMARDRPKKEGFDRGGQGGAFQGLDRADGSKQFADRGRASRESSQMKGGGRGGGGGGGRRGR
jgi:hypothetical protein